MELNTTYIEKVPNKIDNLRIYFIISSGSRPGDDLYAGNLYPNIIVPPRIISTQMNPANAETTEINPKP